MDAVTDQIHSIWKLQRYTASQPRKTVTIFIN